ncbi:MAG: primosomal protein N' [Candidatus Edwardsbacteria bacterium]
MILQIHDELISHPCFAEVVFPLPLDQTFTYSIPVALVPQAKVGCRVVAPLGPRKKTGYLVAFSPATPPDGEEKKPSFSKIKPLLEVPDIVPILSEEMLKLTRWIADYYLCSWGEAIKAALPAGIERRSQKFFRLIEPYPESIIKSQISPASLCKAGRANLKSQNLQLLTEIIKTLRKETMISRGRLKKFFPNRELEPLLDTLVKKGILEITEKSAPPRASFKLEKYAKISKTENEIVLPTSPFVLNQAQQKALKEITSFLESGLFKAFLLYGVTGSGKTEVYLQAIDRCLKQGKQAIVLIPEISLTPQTVNRFKERFSNFAILHSRLSLGERYDSWQRIKNQECQIVIGARSAVFAPFENLGLIIVDEEQEWSYKQSEEKPRYQARDVAVMRAKNNNAVVILGSATPSLESYYNAQQGKYTLLRLPERVESRPLPQINITDMRQRKGEILFPLLEEKIKERLQKKEQVLLFLNRRGFSTFIQCGDCGLIARCPNCYVTMTYHLPDTTLRCHYCGKRFSAWANCPKCHGYKLLYRGVGTQKVEEEIKKKFPEANILRMDFDTTRRRDAHRQILSKFICGEAEILLGTQMITKGLDIPNVSLVGVISADTSLNLPDFRAGERTFQLLTQVAGRAGRGETPGEVVIQTYVPENSAILAAKEQDFLHFFSEEIKERKEMNYPPFVHLASILMKSKSQKTCEETAHSLCRTIKETLTNPSLYPSPSPQMRDPALAGQGERKGGVEILGPAPAPLSKLKGLYRWQVLIKGEQNLSKIIKFAFQKIKKTRLPHNVHLTVDIDPYEMM